MTRIEKAVRTRDLDTLDTIVIHMRYSLGLNYTEMMKVFIDQTPIQNEREFEKLMYDLDNWIIIA